MMISSILKNHSLVSGFLLTNLSSVASIILDYSFKLSDAVFSEVIFCASLLFLIPYLVISVIKKEVPNPQSKLDYLLMLWQVLLYGTGVVGSLFAVRLMPLSDLVVIKFSAPLCSMLMARILLKEKLKPLNIFCGILIIFGVLLVVRPTYLIRYLTSGEESNKDVNDDEYPQYWVGVAVGFASAFSLGTVKVVAKRLLGALTFHHIMIIVGLGILGATCVSLGMNYPNRIIYSPNSIPPIHLAICLGLGLLIFTKGSLITFSVKVSNPVLVQAVRSLEIIMVVLIDTFYLSIELKPLSAIGSVIVLISVLCISFHLRITETVKKLCSSKRLTDTVP